MPPLIPATIFGKLFSYAAGRSTSQFRRPSAAPTTMQYPIFHREQILMEKSVRTMNEITYSMIFLNYPCFFCASTVVSGKK
jgi:hypothetical protein